MNNHHTPPESSVAKVIVRGIHLRLTEAMRSIATEKATRLLRHNSYIIRVRVDLEYDSSRTVKGQFVAKGHIEIGGPDLIASAASDDAYKSLDLLIAKLDRLLLRRHGLRKGNRHHFAPMELAAGQKSLE